MPLELVGLLSLTNSLAMWSVLSRISMRPVIILW